MPIEARPGHGGQRRAAAPNDTSNDNVPGSVKKKRIVSHGQASDDGPLGVSRDREKAMRR